MKDNLNILTYIKYKSNGEFQDVLILDFYLNILKTFNFWQSFALSILILYTDTLYRKIRHVC